MGVSFLLPLYSLLRRGVRGVAVVQLFRSLHWTVSSIRLTYRQAGACRSPYWPLAT